MQRWRENKKEWSLDDTLADPASRPGCSPEEKKFLEFQQVVERVLTEEAGEDGQACDWPSIRASCPECSTHNSNPWNHYVYHRRSNRNS
jgi:hypothetical protein